MYINWALSTLVIMKNQPKPPSTKECINDDIFIFDKSTI